MSLFIRRIFFSRQLLAGLALAGLLCGHLGAAEAAPDDPKPETPTAQPVTPVPEPEAVPAPLTVELPTPKDPPAPGEVLNLEKFRVEGKAVQNSQRVLRQNAAVAVDMLTNRDFSKFIASDVSDIVIRMPGFSTSTRGSFAVVRGLGERYNPILLDGVTLPSSDPERQTPELDLFPTRLVDAVVVNKVFSPRLPGTSSGGAVDLRTKPLPDGRVLQLQLGVRADESVLRGEEFRNYRGRGFWDYLALGARDRPATPATGSVAADVTAILQRINNPATALLSTPHRFPIGTRLGFVAENRYDLGGDGRALGYSFNLTHDTSASSESSRKLTVPILLGTPTKISSAEAGTVVFEGEDYEAYQQETRLGILATLGFAFNPQHTLSLSAFYSQIGEDSVSRTSNGFESQALSYADVQTLWRALDTGSFPADYNSQLDGGLLFSESLYYRERNLTNYNFSGRHDFAGKHEVKLNWTLARLSVQQQDPDFWIMPYSWDDFTTPALDSYATTMSGGGNRSPTRYWRDVREKSNVVLLNTEALFDLGWMADVRVETGLSFGDTARTFLERSFPLSLGSIGSNSRGATVADLVASLRQRAPNLSTNLVRPFANADRRLTTAHASLTLPLLAKRRWVEKLDLLLGARQENFQLVSAGRGIIGNSDSASVYLDTEFQVNLGGLLIGSGATPGRKIVAATQFIGPALPGQVFQGSIKENTVHPVAALTWSPLPRLNLRASYSQTVARPSFREVGPYFTRDEVDNVIQHGNVFLRTSQVDNLDFRVEYFFPQSRDLIALSLFTKKIAHPIERAALPVENVSSSTITWFNNPDTATLQGAELELVKNLGFLGPTGSWITVGGNATYIRAEVARNQEPVFPGAAAKRRLFDQPEWIANAYLTIEPKPAGLSATLAWYAISDTLQKVGQTTWSTFTAAHTRLDLTVSQRIGRHWQIRFSAKNLLDPVRKFIADPEVTTEEVVLRTFQDGRNYSLTTTYEF